VPVRSKTWCAPLTPEDWQSGGFGVYFHWPFCLAKCPYCDFNSHVTESIDQERWKRAYLSEIDRIGVFTSGRILNTVYFGGGTPSLMQPDLVDAVLDRVRRTWRIANDMEITLEANPTSVETRRFRGYREAGVNRVSLGIQALNDVDLRNLGRRHSTTEARTALDIAKSTFERVSFDLIYARQHQTLDAWKTELTEALTFAGDHLSLYQLTIEDGTAFGARHARGKLSGLPDEDTAADMYFLTQELCQASGLPSYEVSNHAKDGNESRHNLIYWRYGDYAGIGPGAHGRLTSDAQRYATDTTLLPQDWLEAVERRGNGDRTRTLLTRANQGVEYVMMGLRLRDGISLSRFERLVGHPLDPTKIRVLEDLQMLRVTGDRVRTTENGSAVLNAVLRDLLTD